MAGDLENIKGAEGLTGSTGASGEEAPASGSGRATDEGGKNAALKAASGPKSMESQLTADTETGPAKIDLTADIANTGMDSDVSGDAAEDFGDGNNPGAGKGERDAGTTMNTAGGITMGVGGCLLPFWPLTIVGLILIAAGGGLMIAGGKKSSTGQEVLTAEKNRGSEQTAKMKEITGGERSNIINDQLSGDGASSSVAATMEGSDSAPTDTGMKA